MADDWKYCSKVALLAKIGSLSDTLRMQIVLLYLLLIDPDTPAWAKALIVGALGLLILSIPGMPFIGFSEDLVVLAAVCAALDKFVTPELRERARSWLL